VKRIGYCDIISNNFIILPVLYRTLIYFLKKMIYKNVIRQTKKKKKRKRLSLRSSGAIVINEKTSSTFLKSSEKRRETISSKYNDIDDFPNPNPNSKIFEI
jgi:hypothetical protein